ncbi:uncharacterized protein LOC119402282 isoform X9 [Rhipicephalus sanguineus]|uniref:uncharacterized protein LOC119402282 isoform X9 n=1 Tax=Rhipicephalus sanguineus TaxID=34632 RepID=UPI0018932804|nr:uncharacterized protein LOC119402282 isoform X9 [Rhipicephalus sanguineus]
MAPHGPWVFLLIAIVTPPNFAAEKKQFFSSAYISNKAVGDPACQQGPGEPACFARPSPGSRQASEALNLRPHPLSQIPCSFMPMDLAYGQESKSTVVGSKRWFTTPWQKSLNVTYANILRNMSGPWQFMTNGTIYLHSSSIKYTNVTCIQAKTVEKNETARTFTHEVNVGMEYNGNKNCSLNIVPGKMRIFKNIQVRFRDSELREVLATRNRTSCFPRSFLFTSRH